MSFRPRGVNPPDSGLADAALTEGERRMLKNLAGRLERGLSSYGLVYLSAALEDAANMKRAQEERGEAERLRR